jgi:hypothetical protein
MAVCRAFQRTGEYKWELVKRKDWQLSSTTWDDQRARLFLIHAKLEATVSASVYCGAEPIFGAGLSLFWPLVERWRPAVKKAPVRLISLVGELNYNINARSRGGKFAQHSPFDGDGCLPPPGSTEAFRRLHSCQAAARFI